MGEWEIPTIDLYIIMIIFLTGVDTDYIYSSHWINDILPCRPGRDMAIRKDANFRYYNLSNFLSSSLMEEIPKRVTDITSIK